MTRSAVRPARAPRKDAARNRDALMTAAAEVFAERGIEASLEEIARRAGVGIGTLYRHFPNRDVLNEAVYRREVDLLCDAAATYAQQNGPVEALRIWMRRFTAYVALKRGMAGALKSALGAENELFTYSAQRIRAALGALVAAAVDSGEISARADVEELLRGMSGICMASELSGTTDYSSGLVDLLIDGLRYRAARED